MFAKAAGTTDADDAQFLHMFETQLEYWGKVRQTLHRAQQELASGSGMQAPRRYTPARTAAFCQAAL